MRSLKLETGGRPFTNDDLATLQANDALLGLPALLNGIGPCIVSGCLVSGSGPAYNVGPGMVWDGSQLLDFPGRGAATLPLMFQAGAVTAENERPYQTGGTRVCLTGQQMALVPVVAGAPNLVLDTYGALTFWHRLQEKTREVSEMQQLANLNGADYDSNGLGKPGTTAWGWALCNGQNDTADLRGMFILGHNPDRDNDGRGNPLSTTAVGDGGGEETHALSIAEMPPHAHTASVEGTGTDASTNYAVFGALQNGSNSQQQPRRTATTNSAGGASGAVQAHNNMPPYYVLAFRQWVGY